jgi:hypothetical protein
MTDYYPVILRAVAALETNTFEARRAIYNRVRAVQSYQLGQRPFNKADLRQSPPSGNAIFQGRDKDPETAPAIQWAGCRDKMGAESPTVRGYSY